MTNSCEQIKTEYKNLKTLKEEFDLEYQKAVETGELERVREMRTELEEKRDALQEKLFVSPEKAKEIMGKEDFLDQKAVEKAFGIKLNKQEIPRIPFKREELERAKELGQFLILRTDKAPDGQPLTMEKMNELLQVEFEEKNKGKILYGDWYKDEDFFTKETPKLEWALTSKEVIPNSTNKSYLEQTELIADYLKNQVFKDKQLPKQYEEAIQEFNKHYQYNFRNKTKEEIRAIIGGNQWGEVAKQLSKLKINQLTRQSPSEVLYDILIYFQNNNQRLLENKYTCTSYCSFYGYLSFIGSFDSDGARVDGWSSNFARAPLGVSFSRSL
ncbi:hypothetical protein KKC49_00685 [Patescibacteria group bacterium]|nr:hypothetical protein [Patescibacteria group bacterium]MCG2809255.1 hypothetical protein [Candidatus Portnoybacteria bacterium]